MDHYPSHTSISHLSESLLSPDCLCEPIGRQSITFLTGGYQKKKFLFFLLWFYKSQLPIQSNYNIDWMSEHPETPVSLYTKYLPTFPQLIIWFPIRLSNLIQDSVSRHYTSCGRKSGSLNSPSYNYNISLDLRRKYLGAFIESSDSFLKLKQVSTLLVLFLRFYRARIRRVIVISAE